MRTNAVFRGRRSKKGNSFLSISSDEEESKEEEEKSNKNSNKIFQEKIYKNNDDNKLNNNTKESLNKKDEDKEYILKLRNKLNNNIVKTKNKKMLILPPPENELIDKHSKVDILQDDDQDNKGYIKLMNPDNMNLNIKETDLNNNINNDKNIISINQKDILDQNWEMKYINKILKKDMKEAFKNEDEKEGKEEKDKMNNKKRKREKNKDNDELNEENIRSKYDKITTKKRYGW